MSQLPQDSHPATPLRRWPSLAIAALAAALFTMDTSLNLIALPAIAQSFDASPAEVIWVTVSVQLVILGLALSIGSLSQALGQRRLFTMGFGVFLVGLIGSFLAPALPFLIASRTVQGLGLALFVSTRNAIAVERFPPHRRGAVMGVIIGAVGIGSAIGPLLGGFLVETASWRFIYLAELPMTLLCGTLSLLFLQWETRQRLVSFDLAGTVLILVGAVALLVALNRLADSGLGSPAVISLGASGLALVSAFVWHEGRAARPVLDLALLRRRVLAFPSLVLALQVAGHAAIIVLLPFFLIQALELRTTTAGFMFAVAPAMMFVGSVTGGPLSDRLGAPMVQRGSMAIALGGALLLLPLEADGSLLQVAAAQALLGAGAGILQATTGGAILNAVPPHRLAMSSALFIAIIMLGGALGGNLGGILMTASQRSAEAAHGPGAAAAAAAYRPVALAGALFLAAGLAASLLPSSTSAQRATDAEQRN